VAAIRRFEGPAKGKRFKTKEVTRMLKSSYHAANSTAPTSKLSLVPTEFRKQHLKDYRTKHHL
jgi:hypothetical protein